MSELNALCSSMGIKALLLLCVLDLYVVQLILEILGLPQV
jgi:hypothetical protein